MCLYYTKAKCAYWYILLRTLVIATHKLEYVYNSRLLKRAMFKHQSKNYFSQGFNEFSKQLTHMRTATCVATTSAKGEWVRYSGEVNCHPRPHMKANQWYPRNVNINKLFTTMPLKHCKEY